MVSLWDGRKQKTWLSLAHTSASALPQSKFSNRIAKKIRCETLRLYYVCRCKTVFLSSPFNFQIHTIFDICSTKHAHLWKRIWETRRAIIYHGESFLHVLATLSSENWKQVDTVFKNRIHGTWVTSSEMNEKTPSSFQFSLSSKITRQIQRFLRNSPARSCSFVAIKHFYKNLPASFWIQHYCISSITTKDKRYKGIIIKWRTTMIMTGKNRMNESEEIHYAHIMQIRCYTRHARCVVLQLRFSVVHITFVFNSGEKCTLRMNAMMENCSFERVPARQF